MGSEMCIRDSTITAGTGTGGFSGKGTSITGLNATNLSSGVIHKNRYTTSVPDDNSIFFYDTAISELNVVPPNTSGTKYLKSVGTSGDLSWDTVTATISIGNDNTSDERDLVFTTDDTDLKRDTDGGIKYTPSSNTLSIGDTNGNYKTLSASGWTGNAATATKADSIENAPDTTAADKPVAFLIGDNVKTTTNLTINPSTAELKATKFSGNGSGLTHLNFEASNSSGEVPVDHGGTGLSTIGSNHILIGNGTGNINTIAPEPNNTAKFLSSYSNGNLAWTSPSVSGISISNDNLSATGQGITFAASTGAQTIKSDQSTLHYKPSTGTLTTSNLITSGTSQFNGIANTAPTSTFSVGTVFSIQEWDGSGDPIDVMVVRKGNAFYEGNVYIGKTLTVPSGGKIEADTIKVRSHNVSGTTVINERKATIQRID